MDRRQEEAVHAGSELLAGVGSSAEGSSAEGSSAEGLYEVPFWREEDLPILAQYSGFPGINRRAVYDRALHEAVLARLTQEGRLPEHFILANFSAGTTVAAYAGINLLDCNNARDGEGPMGLAYSGSLPTEPLIHFAFQSGKPLAELQHKLTESGWEAYKGILKREQWEEIWLYQVLKEIGAMRAVLKMRANVVIAVGTLSKDLDLMRRLRERLPSPLRLEVMEPDLSRRN